MFNYLKKVMFEEHKDDGTDLPNQDNAEKTQDSDAQKIIDRINGEENPSDNDDVKLPSDEQENPDDKKDGDTLFADKYKTVDELKAGIAGLKSTLPDYVIDGMSNEALEKHYVELRKEFSGKQDDNKDRKFAKDEKPDDKPDEKEVDKKQEISGLWKELELSFKSTGGISNDMYDKFEELGIPSEIVDGYTDNIYKEQVSFTNKVYEMSGGQEQYNEIKEWAESGNIHESELKAIESMGYDAMLSALSGIKARYDLAKSKDIEQTPKRIVGETGSNTGNSYTSQEQYLKDVADRRYGQNRAYTELVEKKFANSKFQ